MMTLRQAAALVLIAVSVGACQRRPAPAATPAPTASSDADRLARERARADSIAAAERARREAEARGQAGEIARVREALTDMIFFEYDSEQLTADAEDRLRTKAAILRANPTLQIRVEGHADERGSTEYNLALAQRRAESVRSFLGGYGIAANRVGTISYGKERPLVEGTGESIWARNRRAEFVVTSGDISAVPSEVR
jgi:peptidoglycan-associated lipoprotein